MWTGQDGARQRNRIDSRLTLDVRPNRLLKCNATAPEPSVKDPGRGCKIFYMGSAGVHQRDGASGN
jgi:hypothetical protein